MSPTRTWNICVSPWVIVGAVLLLTSCYMRDDPQWWPRDATLTLHDSSGCDWVSESHNGLTTITAQCDSVGGQRAMSVIAAHM